LYKILGKQHWIGVLLWSNQFYGICALLIAIESSVLILHAIPPFPILACIHLSTVLFYTNAYLLENVGGIYNERTSWYLKNKKYLLFRQTVYFGALLYYFFTRINLGRVYENNSFFAPIALCISLLVCVFYYLPHFFPKYTFSSRNNGVLKTISIAWVWTFTTCIFPLWFAPNFKTVEFGISCWLYTIQLFIFIFILAILFDIKDVNRDQHEKISTIYLKVGKEKFNTRVLLPILILYGTLHFVDYIFFQHAIIFLVIQLLITFLVFIVSKIVMKMKSIYMNIILIDGLMIIKAFLSLIYFFFLQ